VIVKVIPPKIKQEPRADSGQKKKALRVAAYCRVSTDLDEQESSYEAQVSHYAALIRKTPGWRLAGIYADEGISGTSILKREDFRRLITDCEEKKIDLVITKSISRFARNTLDCLKYIRRLKELGIPVIFEKENINTLDARGELLITIMASIAQQESQSISQNVRMGIQYRFQQGKPMLNHSRFLGYTKKRGGPLCIVPAEAIVVRQIFRDFLEGMTVGEIIEKLEGARVPSPAGKRKWYHSTVLSMLRNEKYMGDLLLQKSYTTDFLTGARKRNQGNLPQYYVENDHEPIIPREVFLRVQAELRSRSLKKSRHRETGESRHAPLPHGEASLRPLQRGVPALLAGAREPRQCRLALPESHKARHGLQRARRKGNRSEGAGGPLLPAPAGVPERAGAEAPAAVRGDAPGARQAAGIHRCPKLGRPSAGKGRPLPGGGPGPVPAEADRRHAGNRNSNGPAGDSKKLSAGFTKTQFAGRTKKQSPGFRIPRLPGAYGFFPPDGPAGRCRANHRLPG